MNYASPENCLHLNQMLRTSSILNILVCVRSSEFEIYGKTGFSGWQERQCVSSRTIQDGTGDVAVGWCPVPTMSAGQFCVVARWGP